MFNFFLKRKRKKHLLKFYNDLKKYQNICFEIYRIKNEVDFEISEDKQEKFKNLLGEEDKLKEELIEELGKLSNTFENLAINPYYQPMAGERFFSCFDNVFHMSLFDDFGEPQKIKIECLKAVIEATKQAIGKLDSIEPIQKSQPKSKNSFFSKLIKRGLELIKIFIEKN